MTPFTTEYTEFTDDRDRRGVLNEDMSPQSSSL